MKGFRTYLRYSMVVMALSVFISAFPNKMSAQTWSSGSGGAIYYNSGNVGIGTTSPAWGLDVGGAGSPGNLYSRLGSMSILAADSGYEWYTGSFTASAGPWQLTHRRISDGTWTNVLTILPTGNVGIGTTSPAWGLDVGGAGSNLYSRLGSMSILTADSGYEWYTGSFTTSVGPWQLTHRRISDGTWTNALTVLPTGNVGIGTTSPTNLLSVNGTVQAKEVLVNTGWSDYVFSPNYQLAPLGEVAQYIREHHHLPDIPSEAEVQANGVSLGDVQAKLLAKVEELTLHMIQLEQENGELRQEVKELRGSVLGQGKP